MSASTVKLDAKDIKQNESGTNESGADLTKRDDAKASVERSKFSVTAVCLSHTNEAFLSHL